MLLINNNILPTLLSYDEGKCVIMWQLSTNTNLNSQIIFNGQQIIYYYA